MNHSPENPRFCGAFTQLLQKSVPDLITVSYTEVAAAEKDIRGITLYFSDFE